MGRAPARLRPSKELVGDRPAGETPLDVADRADRACGRPGAGLQPVLTEGSTDANLPMSLRIPAITIGGGGSAANSHALSESFDATDAWNGTQNAVLLAIALSRTSGVSALQPSSISLEPVQVGRALAAGFAPRGQNPHGQESVGDAQDDPFRLQPVPKQSPG